MRGLAQLQRAVEQPFRLTALQMWTGTCRLGCVNNLILKWRNFGSRLELTLLKPEPWALFTSEFRCVSKEAWSEDISVTQTLNSDKTDLSARLFQSHARALAMLF